MNYPAILPKLFSLFVFLLAASCNEEMVEPLAEDTAIPSGEVTAAATASSIACSSCDYIVPATAGIIDAQQLGIKPGDVICFSAAIRYANSITIRNINGTAAAPVIITNCGGTANLTVTSRPFNLKFANSKFFRLTGGNTPDGYGIRISGSTSNGLVLCELSTNFEVDHVEVANVGFAGIMAKTDPTCNNITNRGYFTMRDVSIHDNYVHHTGGEGLYVGHTFYAGYTLSCGVKLPHLIENIRIYKNKVSYTGWDGIQLSSAPKGAQVYGNSVSYFGTKQKADQNYGILLGAGTGGTCHSNLVSGGTGTSLTAFGNGDNTIYNNVILNSARVGIFVDERTTTFGVGYRILNNTIINPKGEGMRIYSEKVPKNVVLNNIIVNPGSFATYGASSYIMKLNSVTRLEMSNNYTTRNINDVKFVNPSGGNYRLLSGSPAINKGKSILVYNIPLDFYAVTRLKGTAYDIGASEF